MKRSYFLTVILLLGLSFGVRGEGDSLFDDGILIVNEDWYGHQNSTVNFLRPDNPEGEYWDYRAFQTANPGYELGCTNQYGAYWEGKYYFIAKQAKDPGASVTGGRLTVADGKTLKMLHQQETIAPDGRQCDGRGFVGIDSHKGYISTSNGIWILDLDTYRVTGPIDGSESGSNSLYKGQCGNMVLVDGIVFAAHQSKGVLVIDTATDALVRTIPMDFVQKDAGIGSIVKSKDGNLWLSVAADVRGTGNALDLIVRLDPHTFETKVIKCPEGLHGPANSWYAWTPDAFVAAQHSNTLYWKGGQSSWFSGSTIYSYDIDNDKMELFINLDEDKEGWQVYGCSMGSDPQNGDLYISLFKDFSSRDYVTRRYSETGEKIKDYAMIQNYWFPSNMIFRSPSESGIGLPIIDSDSSETVYYTLDGIKLDTKPSHPGIYLIRQGRNVRKVRIN